jgi:poly(beta-D-mannuronate) lyase
MLKNMSMKKIVSLVSMFLILLSCPQKAIASSSTPPTNTRVTNLKELKAAIKNSVAGDHIILANGTWKDAEIKFFGKGTKQKPIVLRAETPGKVFIEGVSNLKLSGSYLEVRDLYFKNGYTPSNSLIQFKINNDSIANNCKVTQCVIEEFTQPDRDVSDHWVEFWGRNNELSNCYITGKSNFGPTVRVFLDGNEHINNYHQIINNHFGPRPRKGGPHGETIQIGDSETSMTPSYTNVYHNLFDRCNGEVEIISSKSNFNQFRKNIFFESEGSLVLRHGNYAMIDSNLFIGTDNSNQMGGIRVINTGHWITNNYFYKIKGESFRSAIAIMNGIPKSSLNRYNQVTDVVVAYNSFIDCISPWQFSVGANLSQKAVLPASEIRSARPERVLLANNIIYNQVPDTNPIVNFDKVDGVTFKNNSINSENKSEIKPAGLVTKTMEMNQFGKALFVPKENDTALYNGFDFETITTDLFGTKRDSSSNSIGAIVNPVQANAPLVDKSKFGTNWFQPEKTKMVATSVTVSTSEELVKQLSIVSTGTTILLRKGTYKLNQTLAINKEITLRSVDKKNKAKLIFTAAKTAFELQPKANLSLKDLIVSGDNSQNAFTTLDKLMSKAYDLRIENTDISNFKTVLEVSKGSFADTISVINSKISNCANGFLLNKETNDGGDYNAEFVTFTNSKFDAIQGNVLDYYRGGYDESTIGGNLKIEGNTFTNCCKMQPENLLIKNKGIVYVTISKNTFENNPVKLIAILWGAKGQAPANNTIVNSGRFEVVQNLELKLMY